MRAPGADHVHTLMNKLNERTIELAHEARVEGFLGGVAVGGAVGAVLTREWGLLALTVYGAGNAIVQRIQTQDYRRGPLWDVQHQIRGDFLDTLPPQAEIAPTFEADS